MPQPFSNGARPQHRVCRPALARAVHSAFQQGCSARGDGAAAVTPPHSSDGWHGRWRSHASSSWTVAGAPARDHAARPQEAPADIDSIFQMGWGRWG